MLQALIKQRVILENYLTLSKNYWLMSSLDQPSFLSPIIMHKPFRDPPPSSVIT